MSVTKNQPKTTQKQEYRRPPTRFDRICYLRRTQEDLTRLMKRKFQTNLDMFDVMCDLEFVEKEIEVQKAFEQHEVAAEAEATGC